MKTTNKFLAIILCVVAILMPKVAWAESNFEDEALDEPTSDGIALQYKYDSRSRTAEVVRPAEGYSYSGDIVIPDKIKSSDVWYTVTSIGRQAFYYFPDVTSVIIPNSITNIGDGAFWGCTSLRSIVLPDKLETLGIRAFMECSSLKRIVIPETVKIKTIGEGTFKSCTNLLAIRIPDSVTNIDIQAFTFCSSLESVYVGNSVATIAQHAFYSCTDLTSVTLGSSVSSIEKASFTGCPHLKDVYCFSESVPTTDEFAFSSDVMKKASLYVLPTMMDAFREAVPWKSFKLKGAYEITTNCNEDLGSCTGGNKLYLEDETATLTAISKTDIAFGGWDDGNKENPRSIQVGPNTPLSYTAVFRTAGYDVTTGTNDSELGTATAERVVYMEATPTSKGEFVQWSDGITDNPRMIPLESLTESKEIIAEFKNGPMLIADGDQYTLTDAQTVEKLNYARGYNNNVWSAWFVPFAVDATTLKDNGFDAAYIEGMHRYDRDDDGVIDETVMEVVKIKNGRLRAGTPYLVKAGETYSYPLSLTDVTVESANDIHNLDAYTTTAQYNFNGTYTGVTAEEVQAADNYYSLNAQGELVHRNGKILPLRWFMELIDRGGVYDEEPGSSPSSVIRIKVIGEEDTETGLRTMYPESEQKVEKFDGMFDLSGRRLSAPQRGINIINGKKTLIK